MLNAKKTPHGDVLLYVDNCMAGHVAQNWNTIWPSLLTMHQKLAKLEATYKDLGKS